MPVRPRSFRQCHHSHWLGQSAFGKFVTEGDDGDILGDPQVELGKRIEQASATISLTAISAVGGEFRPLKLRVSPLFRLASEEVSGAGRKELSGFDPRGSPDAPDSGPARFGLVCQSTKAIRWWP